MSKAKVRSLFLSDIHLGFRGCQAERLLAFLKSVSAERIYLVGDIIDLWSMQARLFWPTAHHDIVKLLIKRQKQGVKVIFIPGNHDNLLRDYAGFEFAGIEIHLEYECELANGRKALLLHGDKFDLIIQDIKWLAILGSRLYDFSLALNRYLSAFRKKLGLPYWSLSAYLKKRVKGACNYISNFEEAVAKEAELRSVDVIVAGHIHHAEIRQMGTVTYANCGDWVESCTAIVEHFDGSLELVYG